MIFNVYQVNGGFAKIGELDGDTVEDNNVQNNLYEMAKDKIKKQSGRDWTYSKIVPEGTSGSAITVYMAETWQDIDRLMSTASEYNEFESDYGCKYTFYVESR